MRKYTGTRVGRAGKGGKIHCTIDRGLKCQGASRGRYLVGTSKYRAKEIGYILLQVTDT